MADRPIGVMLVNLGTPESPTPRHVRRYLSQFLSDPRVLDMPAPIRWLLLRFVILPFRPRASSRAYASIWTPQGSPLLIHSVALRDALATALGDRYRVELAMTYGEPSIDGAFDRLQQADVERIVIVPLYPQYASSSTGSALSAVFGRASARAVVPDLQIVGAFYDDPSFIAAVVDASGGRLAGFRADHVLMSYHGLPERQVRNADPGGHCLARESCCDAIGPENRNCYRAQCFATSRTIASALGLGRDQWSVSFQSRLGSTPWILPHTDRTLEQLAARGVRRVAILCPSFVADCLETLEEIGIRAREQWTRELGGEDLLLLPCVNSHPTFVDAVASLVRARAT
jgi:ferrochelatase